VTLPLEMGAAQAQLVPAQDAANRLGGERTQGGSSGATVGRADKSRVLRRTPEPAAAEREKLVAPSDRQPAG
jgi:hypothetical protein